MLVGQALAGSGYAPPFVYGRVASGDVGIFGRYGHRVTYRISTSGNAGSQLCCKVSVFVPVLCVCRSVSYLCVSVVCVCVC